MNKNIYSFTVTTIDGKQKSLADYKGKAILIVNVASYCCQQRFKSDPFSSKNNV